MNGAGKTGGEGAARGGDVTAQGQLRLAPGATAKSGKRAAAEGYTQTFNANCLNCGVELHMSLGPKVQSFQCCQCYAVHQVAALFSCFVISPLNFPRWPRALEEGDGRDSTISDLL